VLQRILHAHSGLQGTTIEGIRMHEIAVEIAFLGRRRRVYRRIVALSGARPGDRILDVGCGGGYLARLLAAAVTPNGQVTGIDPAGPAIGYANRRNPGNCSFGVGVAQHLDAADRSFDVVTSTLAIHHIPAAARPAAFGEMYRVTRPGGRFLVAEFDPGNPHPGGRRALRHHDVEGLDELVTAAGFHLEKSGELPRLRYIQAVRPDIPTPAEDH
jgi:ubiquinone/menaquinone biosynthesis C-methylase UbiE